MEYSLLIPVGNTQHRITFTGGSHTPYGIRDATYSTDNPVLQFCIEHSKHFTRGEIKLQRQFGTADEPAAKKPQTKVSKKSSASVEVKDLDEARQYLIEKCGIDGMTLIGEKAIRQSMSLHNVTIKNG